MNKLLRRNLCLAPLALAAILSAVPASAAETFVRPANAPTDVRPDRHNIAVTALSEDCESVRMALGAAWDAAQAARSFAWYLRPWSDQDSTGEAKALIERGAAEFEYMRSIDGGMQSVRLARDSGGEYPIERDVAFWRNELALAAERVLAYADHATALKTRLASGLREQAVARGIAPTRINERPWPNPLREAWRQAGAMTGIMIPIEPDPDSFAQWWLETLSLDPAYMATKFGQAGNAFITPEVPVGAWGFNATGADGFDWTALNRYVRTLNDRGVKLLLELPTLQRMLTAEEQQAQEDGWLRNGTWTWGRYAPPVPEGSDLARVCLHSQADAGATQPWGGVQLLDAEVAAAYGRYLRAMAENLEREGLYDTIAAIHLERGDNAELSEEVDYSPATQRLWRQFMESRYGAIAKLNEAAATDYASFENLPIPARGLEPAAADDWNAFKETKDFRRDANAWGKYLSRKYGAKNKIREALGSDFTEGYGWRLPFDYPPILKIDYLHFRRQWVRDYMAVKQRLVNAAFSDKLAILERRQFGDHDMIAQRSEKIWGGFIANDIAQWSGTGPENELQPFMIRSVGPVGFGSRPSDSIESLFRDYLWINFRDPGNLARYFYDWVAHGYMDHQLAWHSITNHWLTNELIYKLGPTVANTAPAPQRIGMLLPRATFDLNTGSIYYEYLGWDWLLHAAKLPYTRIDEHFVRDGGLNAIDLDILILPDVRAMDTAVAAAITQWVQRGGTLIASPLPGSQDIYGRERAVRNANWLADVLGARPGGTVSEAIADKPLTVTIPRGHFSGKWATETDRTPQFQVLEPNDAEVLERYEGGKPAATMNRFGKGRAVAFGYPVGTEAVACEQTSIAFQRTYVLFAREPQLVARVQWLREFIVDRLGHKPDYGVDFAEVARWGPELRESWNPSLAIPKGMSNTTGDYFFVTTVGDPRGGEHEMKVEHEQPDIAIRFFPRRREGTRTTWLGISTRDVHYMTGRAAMHMYLSEHRYHCRINNPSVQAIWDVASDVPVGFTRDDLGVAFDVQLPSGHIMMLAISEAKSVELFRHDEFPGRTTAEVIERARQLAGGTRPQPVAILTPGDLGPWFEELGRPVEQVEKVNENLHPGARREVGKKEIVRISYGEAGNRAAAEKLAGFLARRYGIDAQILEQAASITDYDQPGSRYKTTGWHDVLVLIGNEWTNNDMALHESMWPWGYGGTERSYGPHVPFTACYNWPGPGRAVVSLSRGHALLDEAGRQVSYRFKHEHRIRPVKPDYPKLRRKLFIAADGDDALRAVDAIIDLAGGN